MSESAKRWTLDELRFAAEALRAAVRDGADSDAIGEWFRPSFLADEVAPMLDAYAAQCAVASESALDGAALAKRFTDEERNVLLDDLGERARSYEHESDPAKWDHDDAYLAEFSRERAVLLRRLIADLESSSPPTRPETTPAPHCNGIVLGSDGFVSPCGRAYGHSGCCDVGAAPATDGAGSAETPEHWTGYAMPEWLLDFNPSTSNQSPDDDHEAR